MAGTRGATSKKAPRKAGAGGARKDRPVDAAAGRPEKAEGGEKRPARKPRPAGAAESTGLKARLAEAVRFLKSVRAEVKRVSWPSAPEVRAATIVVVLTLVIISGYMGIVDWILTLVFGHKHTGF